MNKILSSLVICAGSFLCVANASAQSYTDPYKGYSEETYMDMDFEPNLATPVVGAKEKPAVRKTILKTANSLKSKYTVDLMREDEVFVVSIPTDDLFLPNDTLLNSRASKILSGVTAPMADPMAYKIVLAMHTDDTGSETYRENLSTARLNSVYDWFMGQIDSGHLNEKLLIIPFAMGGIMPVASNDTREHRRENRRLEIYFIPGPSIIKAAHKAK
jgi:outer membrane protein OmpA-like peptidoglycan-associated protein